MKFAVTISTTTEGGAPRDFLLHNYVPYLQRFGIVPVLVPNVLQDVREYITALEVQGIILSGGGDVAPERYGEDVTYSDNIRPERDATEYALLDLALARRLPVFGICRGMQVINVYFGGSLVQDIPREIGPAVNHDESQHPICVVDARFMEKDLIGGRYVAVNSYHHQGVTAERLARDLDPFALSEPDGIIEGVLHRRYPIMGVQWHPEKGGPSAAVDMNLIRHFLSGGFWS